MTLKGQNVMSHCRFEHSALVQHLTAHALLTMLKEQRVKYGLVQLWPLKSRRKSVPSIMLGAD